MSELSKPHVYQAFAESLGVLSRQLTRQEKRQALREHMMELEFERERESMTVEEWMSGVQSSLKEAVGGTVSTFGIMSAAATLAGRQTKYNALPFYKKAWMKVTGKRPSDL